MKKAFRITVVLVAALCAALPLAADEGMWMPQQIPDLAPRLKELGFTGDPKMWADLTGFPMNAIISLGGCSASFISPDGLIATNHHCVQGALQYNSTPEKNLIVDGFLARTREEELSSGPGSRVWVTVSVKEVTDEITGKIDPKLTDRKRFDVIERRTKERTAACEKDGLRCRVASFFEGLRYFEIAQLEINDVRLVYAPPQGIGNYGGETDNWQWPRHTGDFSFYRAYVGKDGKPAAYSKENVPYHPKHFLKVSPKGASPGELIFVAGYPGRTQRHETYAEVKERTDWALPRYVRRNKEMIAILEATTKGNKELEIKAEPRMRGLLNGMKKNEGVLEGLLKGGILARKEAKQKALETWIAADPQRKKEYGDVLPALAAMQAEDAEDPRAGRRPRRALLRLDPPRHGEPALPPLARAPEEGRRPRPDLPGAELDADEGRARADAADLRQPARPADAPLRPPRGGRAPRRAADRAARHARRLRARDGEGRGGEEGRRLPRRPLRRDEAPREGVPPRRSSRRRRRRSSTRRTRRSSWPSPSTRSPRRTASGRRRTRGSGRASARSTCARSSRREAASSPPTRTPPSASRSAASWASTRATGCATCRRRR